MAKATFNHTVSSDMEAFHLQVGFWTYSRQRVSFTAHPVTGVLFVYHIKSVSTEDKCSNID
jgi:hypothetical protein